MRISLSGRCAPGGASRDLVFEAFGMFLHGLREVRWRIECRRASPQRDRAGRSRTLPRLLACIGSRPQWLEHHGCTPEKVFVRICKGSNAIALNVNGAHNRAVQRDGEDRLGFRSAKGSKPAPISWMRGCPDETAAPFNPRERGKFGKAGATEPVHAIARISVVVTS